MEHDPNIAANVNRTQPRPVYTVVERDGGQRTIWPRVGSAWNNRDGSITIRLEALPVNGVLQIRDAEERREMGGAR